MPCRLLTNHRAISVSPGDGSIVFENSVTIVADLIIGADGIGSKTRAAIGITAEIEPSDTCYRCIMDAKKLRDLGLEDVIVETAINYWGGYGIEKIVIGTCHGGEIVQAYSFYPSVISLLNP